METRVLIPTEENIEYAASLLNGGDVVGIPTETVYGLAANAFDENAVEKIFKAKGRPQDNPLIVHINSLAMLDDLVEYIPDISVILAQKFWPGPLTMIFQKSDKVPRAVTAGLSTVAIRFPSNKITQKLIEKAGMPLAAPSANISGSPSPTTANHVFNDLNGKIKAIIDGGACEYGLESTVVLLGKDKITLLRPGSITVDMLEEAIPNVVIDKGVLNAVCDDEVVASPGMKHTHYCPSASVCIIESDFKTFKNFVEKQADKCVGAMVFDGEENELSVPCVTYGNKSDSIIQAKLLFASLRAIDEMGVKKIYARMPDKNGVGLAIYNRLIRAAGFEVVKL